MGQLGLFSSESETRPLETFIEFENDLLIIPEGLNTIPCTHGIHKFAGKFIPNLPRYLFRQVLPSSKKRTILDPFCGSGTTLVEAALDGRPFIGLDIDPLSVMISKAKTQRLNSNEIATLEKFWRGHDYKKTKPEVVPNVPRLLHWFTERAVEELASLKYRCLLLPPRLKTFSLVIFSSIIRRVSKADDQTQKTYVSHTLPKNPPLPSSMFPIFFRRAIDGMLDYSTLLPNEPKGTIKVGDAVTDIDTLDFDDVITSPPYIDSIDYVYNQMLEYFWLLDELGLKSYENIRAMRKRPMGFRTYDEQKMRGFSKEYLNLDEERYETICHEIGKMSPKEELTVRSFFFDYSRHIARIRAKQRRNGVYVCFIGNSVIRNITVPTSDFVERIHATAGYELANKWDYAIKRHYMKFPRRSNSGKIKQDHILVFRVR